MTAIAIIPPVPSPEDFPPELWALRAEGVLVAEEDVLEDEEDVRVGVVTGIVEVITRTEVDSGAPGEEGEDTIVEVMSITLLEEKDDVVEGATNVVDEGGIEVVITVDEEIIEVEPSEVVVLTNEDVVVLILVVSSAKL